MHVRQGGKGRLSTPVAHMVEVATLTWNWLMVRNAPRRLELSENGWLSAFTDNDWIMGTCAHPQIRPDHCIPQ